MEIQTVRDLIQFLTSFDDNAAVEDVFKEKTNLEILCKIVEGIDPKRLAKPDSRKKIDRSRTAVKEVEGPIFDVPLVALLRVWKDNPEQFFTGWKLDTAGSAVCYDINPSAPGNSTLFCEKVSQMRMLIHKKQEYSIRYIFHTLFFRDLLNGKTDDEGLLARGKAYNEACLKLCLRFLSPEASDELVGEIRNWVKEGQVFHLVGRALGCGALLLLANSITQDKWLKNLPKTASDLRNVLEPLENRVAEETSKYAADEVAQNIREYQLRPYRVDAVGRCAADPSARPRTRAQNQNPASDRESDDRIVDDFSLLGGGLPPEPQSTPRSSSPRRQSPCEDVIPEIRGIMRNQTEHYGNLRYKRPRLEGSNQETCDAPSLHDDRDSPTPLTDGMAAQKSPLQGPSMPQDEDGTTTTTAMGTTHEEIDWESWCTFLEDVNFDHGSLALSSNLDSAPQNERIMGFS